MKEYRTDESEQWIPWEIAYSLRNKTRANSTSKRNAILLVALPDKNGSYNYADQPNFYFNVIQNNINNLRFSYPTKYLRACYQSYMLRCNWNQFILNMNDWINAAVEIKEHSIQYNINTKI